MTECSNDGRNGKCAEECAAEQPQLGEICPDKLEFCCLEPIPPQSCSSGGEIGTCTASDACAMDLRLGVEETCGIAGAVCCSPSPPCTTPVEYTIADPWDSGYNVEVRINGGPSGLSGWTAMFELPVGDQIRNLWDGDYKINGQVVNVTNKDYNANVESLDTVTFGFQVANDGQNPEPELPETVVVNGVACNVGTPVQNVQAPVTQCCQQQCDNPRRACHPASNETDDPLSFCSRNFVACQADYCGFGVALCPGTAAGTGSIVSPVPETIGSNNEGVGDASSSNPNILSETLTLSLAIGVGVLLVLLIVVLIMYRRRVRHGVDKPSFQLAPSNGFANAKARPQKEPVKKSTSAAELVEQDLARSWLIPHSKLKIGKKVAAGGSGQVYRGKFAGHDVAIKELFATLMDRSYVDEFRTEASILATLHHPHVVRFFGVCEHDTSGSLYIVTEWCPRSMDSLLNLSREQRASGEGKIAPDEALRLAAEVADTMSFLHSKGILHRDLKPDNILLTRDNSVKICDFGVSKKLNRQSTINSKVTVQIGTPGFMAPELLSSDDDLTVDGRKLDVYSFGVLLNALFASRSPFTGMNPMRVIAALKTEGLRPRIAEDVPPACLAMIRMCWQEEPSLRPNFEEVAAALREMRASYRSVAELAAEGADGPAARMVVRRCTVISRGVSNASERNRSGTLLSTV